MGPAANGSQLRVSEAPQRIRHNKCCENAGASHRAQQSLQRHVPANRVRKMRWASIVIAIQENGRWQHVGECLPDGTLAGTDSAVEPNDCHAGHLP
jgi:hypothetical protein